MSFNKIFGTKIDFERFFKASTTLRCKNNPESLCCADGLWKCAALIFGTTFGTFLLILGLYWIIIKNFFSPRNPNLPVQVQN